MFVDINFIANFMGIINLQLSNALIPLITFYL